MPLMCHHWLPPLAPVKPAGSSGTSTATGSTLGCRQGTRGGCCCCPCVGDQKPSYGGATMAGFGGDKQYQTNKWSGYQNFANCCALMIKDTTLSDKTLDGSGAELQKSHYIKKQIGEWEQPQIKMGHMRRIKFKITKFVKTQNT